nr:Aminotransferase class-V [uncultured bacterium]
MKNIYFTVGPTQLYETYEKHMRSALDLQIGSLSHRGKEFKALYQDTSELLREIFGLPKNFHIFLTASSLENMERIIENTVAKKSFHVVTGAFGKRFYQTAVELGKKPTKIDVPSGQGWDSDALNIPEGTELIALTQNDTSTGVVLPMKEIYALKKRQPDALVAIDVVSSAPYVKIDWKYIDIAFFSVQKGFGLPAGLGLLVVSEKAVQKARSLPEKGLSIGSYHNFVSMAEKEADWQTPETPNVLNLWLLARVCEDLLQKGMNVVRDETEEKGKLLVDFFSNHSEFTPFVKDTSYRSITSLVIDVNGRSNELAEKLATKGIIIGKGYGDYKHTHIRLANFPSQKIEHVEKLLKTLRM